MRLSSLTLGLVAALAVVLPLASSLTVHVVPHTHDDVGWLKTVDQYYYGLHNDIQHAAVQYIIKSVVAALVRNPARRFMYVEQAFFQRYWREANEYDKNVTRMLVKNGQLEFVNGGWCMHDEAAAHYIDMVDQTTLGHKFIVDEFNTSAVPTVGWQIDPFGHSATQASLLSSQVGFDALFFGRIDYQDHDFRIANKDLEFVWRASPSFGVDGQVFSGAFQSGNYGPPDGFCFDVFDCNDEPIQSNPDVPEYNLDTKVQDFIRAARRQAAGTAGDVETMNIMWNMGSDFQHEASEEWMQNLDKIIDGVNAEGSVKALYSTPSAYVKAKNAESVQWSVKTDDFFPYADGPDSYWTGYFTSRPALKRYIRLSSAFLQVARHLELFSGGDGTATETLWEAQSVAQHHDAISGTAKQAVTFDYARRLAKGTAIADVLVESTLASIVTTTGPAPALAYCPLANVSQCDVVTSNPSSTIVALLYNPTGRATDASASSALFIPSASKAPKVFDAQGQLVPSTTLPVFTNAANANGSATYRTWFRATVPGLGVQTYFLAQGNDAKRGRKAPADLSVMTPPRVADPVLENEGVAVTFDGTTGLIKSVTDKASGVVSPLTQDFAWYASYQVDNQQDSGAYIFRPAVNGTYSLSEQTKLVNLVNTPQVSEAWQQITPWLSQVVRLRAGARGIEMEWTVGPIPVADGQGKEVIIRFNTSLASKGVFYTDSNGREFLQRQRNFRPTWKLQNVQPIAGNYYPVNSAIWLADGTSALVVNVDRAQGCASLVDGVIECMIHRRMTKDDGRGVGEPLNEPGLDGKGLIVTGTTIVHLAPLADAAYYARSTANALYSPVHQSYAPIAQTVSDYIGSHETTVSYLKTDLPLQVELITLQAFTAGQVLLRLSHSYGVGESAAYSTPVTIDLSLLFLLPISGVQEMYLSAALPKGSRTLLRWNTTDAEEEAVGRLQLKKAVPSVFNVTIKPAEVRTFLCTVSHQ